MSGLTRREFLITAGATGAMFALTGCGDGKQSGGKARVGKSPASVAGKLAVASGKDPAALVAAAVGALGGMSAFVKKDDRVVIKPNAAWARRPEDAATTNPKVLAAIVELCGKAGASEIIVVDHVINRPAEMVLQITGIRPACEREGARVVSAGNENMYRKLTVPGAQILSDEQVISDVLDADVLINVPIGKCHSDTKVSLGMKNLMGVIWSRQPWHSSQSVHQCIAEFCRAVRPTLTILDANRILLTNGPQGPGETKDVGQVIAGADPVAVDAYGATLFGLKPKNVEHIRLAHEYGLGEIDLNKVKMMRV
ncbi:MAG: DUF362 domain-containing protein [Armatimonadota bacterium]|nr:DUF362 domain-containing protein [Armatimonadota bacterium]